MLGFLSHRHRYLADNILCNRGASIQQLVRKYYRIYFENVTRSELICLSSHVYSLPCVSLPLECGMQAVPDPQPQSTQDSECLQPTHRTDLVRGIQFAPAHQKPVR